MYTKRPSNPRAWCAAALVLMLGAFAGNALADPPDRVARVSYLRGSVSFQPAGDDQWAEASLNRPLSTGDKVYTDRDGRAELEIGSADIRLDQSSTFNLLNLDDTTAQLELTGGVMNLHVRRVGSGQSYEVDTPTLAFVVNQPGNYRIDIDPQGNSTMISVFDGAGDVYGENNASYSVRAGSSYRFNDSSLRDYETLDLPRADDFDQFVSTRNSRYERSPSRSYVSEDTIGYADLDDNGSWSDEPEYG
ncbi:MAG: FecR domain-containing protein, partial [Burkholderiales bacterium]